MPFLPPNQQHQCIEGKKLSLQQLALLLIGISDAKKAVNKRGPGNAVCIAF